MLTIIFIKAGDLRRVKSEQLRALDAEKMGEISTEDLESMNKGTK